MNLQSFIEPIQNLRSYSYSYDENENYAANIFEKKEKDGIRVKRNSINTISTKATNNTSKTTVDKMSKLNSFDKSKMINY